MALKGNGSLPTVPADLAKELCSQGYIVCKKRGRLYHTPGEEDAWRVGEAGKEGAALILSRGHREVTALAGSIWCQQEMNNWP